MPSPVGHTLAGIATAWIADSLPGAWPWRAVPRAASWYERAGGSLTLTCGLLAAAPDLDLLVHSHRTVTHSLFAVVVVAVVSGFVARRMRFPAIRVAFMCGAAWATHLAMDWVAVDVSTPRGIQLLWPFSQTWFLSGWDLFPSTERNNLASDFAMRKNMTAFVVEVAVFAPILFAGWLVRIKALAGFSTELAGSDHPAQ